MTIKRKLDSKGSYVWQASNGKTFQSFAEAMASEQSPQHVQIENTPTKGVDQMSQNGGPIPNHQYLVESYYDPKKKYIRIRPCPNQGLHANWNLRFPRAFRNDLEPGVKFMTALKSSRSHYLPVGEITWLQAVSLNMRGQEQSRSKRPKVTAQGKPKPVAKLGSRKIQFRKEED